jgi:hypothetical protein
MARLAASLRSNPEYREKNIIQKNLLQPEAPSANLINYTEAASVCSKLGRLVKIAR